MRKTSEIADHRRQVPSGFGRRASLSSGTDAGKFPLAHMVAFQYPILHPIRGSHGLHDVGAGDAPAASPRTSTHAFHSRWQPRVPRRTGSELTATYVSG